MLCLKFHARQLRVVKALVLVGAIYLACALSAIAQEPTPTPRHALVTVTQGFVDDATKAFEMVVTLRDALQKQLEANSASEVTKAALRVQITELNALIVIFERKDVIYQSLLDLRDQAFAVYERVIKLQSEMIDRLTKQLNKGKSGWDKFVSVLKNVATLLAGVAIGRGNILR